MGSLSLFYAMILFSLRLGELPTRGSAASNLVTIAYDTPAHFRPRFAAHSATGHKRNVHRTRSADGNYT